MRGPDITQEASFSTVDLDTFVPADHPLRAIHDIFDEAVPRLDGLFNLAYAPDGKASIAPEKSLRAPMEQVQYNLLFRWFIRLSIDDTVWSHSTFSKNRDRLLEQEVIPALFAEVVFARQRDLVIDEHFSVDGTLIQAWAAQKSFRPRDDQDCGPTGGGRNVARNFHGEKRANATDSSTTDPEAHNYRKSGTVGARLGYLGHTLMDNRHGLMVDAEVSQANGYGERDTARKILDRLSGKRRKTLAADKGYDTRDFVKAYRRRRIIPHIARNTRRPGGSALDGRTTRHEGYVSSFKFRRCIEGGFGWAKTIGQMRQLKARGKARVNDCSCWPSPAGT